MDRLMRTCTCGLGLAPPAIQGAAPGHLVPPAPPPGQAKDARGTMKRRRPRRLDSAAIPGRARYWIGTAAFVAIIFKDFFKSRPRWL